MPPATYPERKRPASIRIGVVNKTLSTCRTIDEMEKKEQALSQRLQELDAIAARNASVAETLSPDDRHTVRSIAASSPAAREGASIRL
jgi:hypothetical protein